MHWHKKLRVWQPINYTDIDCKYYHHNSIRLFNTDIINNIKRILDLHSLQVSDYFFTFKLLKAYLLVLV